MGKIIGIDLGTTNSCVAFLEGGSPDVIINESGARTTPSVVRIEANGTRVVGEHAARKAVMNSKQTVSFIKRLIGRKFDDPKVVEMRKTATYEIVPSKNGDAYVKIDGKTYSPQEISAMILKYLKEAAESRIGQTVTRAVITVPAHFNDQQRQATKDAGEIAGLKVERIINEPTAAALAYGADKKSSGSRLIAIYDLGGGTFDISILDLTDGVFEVKATDGDTFLGGADFDAAIVKYIVDEFKRSNGKDLQNQGAKNSEIMQRLMEVAEKAKKELSSSMQTQINIPYILADEHLDITLTRAKFESIVMNLIEKTIEPCKRALKDAGVTAAEIHDVILVGGMTRMPKVQAEVEKLFGKVPQKGVNPDEVVAIGAAMQGGVISGDVRDVLLLDVIPLSLGIETMGGVFTHLIEKNTTIPNKKSQVFSTAENNQPAVNIRIAQGERAMFKDNKILGEFILDGIPPAPRGVPQIEVTFDVDANGILNVSAKDKNTGKEQRITVKSNGGLDKDEIEKAIKEAAAHEEEDKKRKELIEVKNSADNAIYSTEKSLEEHKSKLAQEDVEAIEKSLQDLKDITKNENATAEEIKSAIENLTNLSMKIGEAVYKQGQEQGGTQTDAQPQDSQSQDQGSEQK